MIITTMFRGPDGTMVSNVQTVSEPEHFVDTTTMSATPQPLTLGGFLSNNNPTETTNCLVMHELLVFDGLLSDDLRKWLYTKINSRY